MNSKIEENGIEIKTAAVVGLGALGLLYGERLQNALEYENLIFPMDDARLERHKNDIYTVNDKKRSFKLVSCSGDAGSRAVDLLVVAVKYPAFESALKSMRPFVDNHTIIISVMNGISTEALIKEAYPGAAVLPCVAIGMDAMREGTSMHYVNFGKLQTGIISENERAAHEALTALLKKADIAYSVEPDIMHAMWKKFMINVGINQSCTVFNASYAGILGDPEKNASFERAMRETMEISRAEGINLNEDDFRAACDLIAGMDPGSYPSMHQDFTAKRKTEVDLFAGTVIKIAKKHGISVPENEFYYRRIRELENAY